jgi:hypothetical protein
MAAARPLAVRVRCNASIALSLGLLEATLGRDPGDEVVVTFFNVKDLIRRPYSTSNRFP